MWLPVGLMIGTAHPLLPMASLSSTDGKLVNLIPGDKPEDIYQAVSDKTSEILLGMTDEPLAKAWLEFGVTGSCQKKHNDLSIFLKSVWFCQSDTDRHDQANNDAVIQGKLDRNPLSVNGDNGAKAALSLAKINYESIRADCYRADACMRFIKGIASVCAG